VDRLEEATLLVTDEGGVVDRLGEDRWRALRRRVELGRSWGDAYGHYLVATGRADIMLDCGLKPWDALPLIPILRGAGGAFVDWEGRSGPHQGDALALPCGLLDELVRHLSGCSAGS